jgi:hypothetical protein
MVSILGGVIGLLLTGVVGTLGRVRAVHLLSSSLLRCALLISAQPVKVLEPRPLVRRDTCASDGGDAPYSLSCDDFGSVITFPNGNQAKAGGIVFLVHGTGSAGEETWGTGPYNTVLPNKG